MEQWSTKGKRGAKLSRASETRSFVPKASSTGLMAIQKNTAISETIVRASGGYEFRLLNECDSPEDIRDFERPGMMTIKLWGVRYGHEHCISFGHDLEDPATPPFNW